MFVWKRVALVGVLNTSRLGVYKHFNKMPQKVLIYEKLAPLGPELRARTAPHPTTKLSRRFPLQLSYSVGESSDGLD